MRARSLAASTVVLLLALTACSGSGAPPEPEGAPTASQTQTPSAEPGPTATPTKDPCPPAERRAARSLRIWDVVARVTSSIHGRSPAATERLRALTRKTVDDVVAVCHGTPSTMSAYLRAVREVGRRPLDDVSLDSAMAGYAEWTDRLGLDVGRKRLADLRACRRSAPSVQVSARVWWGWTPTGRIWWVDLNFRNSLPRELYGQTLGTLRVTGLLRDRYGWSRAAVSAGPGRDGRPGWGGSSADYLEVGHGTSIQRIVPGVDGDIHTTSDGTVRVAPVNVYLYLPGSRSPCSLPVAVTY